MQASRPKPKPDPRGAPSDKSSRPRAPGLPSRKPIPKGPNNASPALRIREGEAENEQFFWSGGKPPRISDKSDSLLSEELDMGGLDALMSPPPAIASKSRPPITSGLGDDANDPADDLAGHETNTDDESDDASGSGEPTIVISKLRPEPASVAAPPSPPPSRPHSQYSFVEPQTPVSGNTAATEATVPPSTKTKVRRVRITADVERICVSLTFSAFFSALDINSHL